MDGELLVERSEKAWVLILRGEHDLSTAPTLEAELSAGFTHAMPVAVDLAEASFIDSSIAGTLVRAWETAEGKEGSAVVVCAPSGSVARRLLDMIGATRVIPTYETRADAIRHLSSAELDA